MVRTTNGVDAREAGSSTPLFPPQRLESWDELFVTTEQYNGY
jgi:hypothetical protein